MLYRFADFVYMMVIMVLKDVPRDQIAHVIVYLTNKLLDYIVSE